MRWAIAILLHVNFYLEPLILRAQEYPFVHYTPKEGLVSARARSIFQDSRGRLHICTFGGLSIYDGARFTNYTTKDGLSTNLINQVVEMSSDSFLVFPNVNKVHALVHGKIQNIVPVGFCPVVNQLIKASDGSFYALTDEGLFTFRNNQFARIEMAEQNGKDVNRYLVKGIEADGRIIMVTDPTMGNYPSPSYLVVYDLKTRQVSISKKPPEVYDVTLSPQRDILVCTLDGLKTLDKRAIARGEINFLPPPQQYTAAAKEAAGTAYFDRQENLWLSLAERVLKIDNEGKTTTFSIENGLQVNRQHYFFQDKEYTMWFGNLQTGISKLTNEQFEYYHEIVPGFKASDLYADTHSDSVWFFDHVDKKLLLQFKNTRQEYDLDVSDNWLFRHLPADRKKYLTGYFEIYKYDAPQGKSIHPKLVYSYRDSMKGVPTVNFPILDQHGNLLFSNDKINVVLANDQLISYPLGYFGDQFVITPSDHLWIVNRANKLFLFKIQYHKPDRYFELLKVHDSIVRGGARSLAIDTKGNLWIGTRDMGLFGFTVDDKFNVAPKYHFTNKTGLSDNCILSLHADENGNTWACSPVGLDKIQQRKNKWVVENVTRGNNIYQEILKVNTTKSGDHWVLTQNGVIRIRATRSQLPENYNAQILLTEIKIKDTIEALANNNTFQHDENDILFQWAVPTFIDEKQTLFSYRLDGSKANHWSELSTESMIRYMNLAPGKYTFHIKANFPNGLYPDKQTSYSFEILPPWWSSWWFKTLVIVTILVGGLLLARSYTRKKLEKQRHELEKQQAVERERTRIASDMHDDMGAGLSSIRFLSEKVKQSSSYENVTNDIGKIVNISSELVENMNEIIWAMNEKNDTLEDLLFYTRSFAKEYCEENNISCLDDFPETIPSQFVSGEVRRNIFLTVKESLHNIVKHADATQVRLIVRFNEKLIVMIQDNGTGFSLVNVDQRSGGNGLKNMKKRIESIGGRFILLNGEGVTIRMEVPIQNL